MSNVVIHHSGEVAEALQEALRRAVTSERSDVRTKFSPIGAEFDGPKDCSLFIDALAVPGSYDDLSPMLHALAGVTRRQNIPAALRFNSPAFEGRGWCRVTSVAWEHYDPA